jgi:hypothetical protein
MIHARDDYNRIQDPAFLIPQEEPVFLIRGQDPNGAKLVRKWAEMNLQDGGDSRLSDLAMNHAIKMEAWPTKKKSDL